MRVVDSRIYLAGARSSQILDLRYGWHQGITFALPAEVPENAAPLALKAVAGPARIAVEAESATGGWPRSWEKVPEEAMRRDGTRVRVTLPADDEERFLRLKVPPE